MLLLWSASIEKGRDLEFKKFIGKNLSTYKKHAPPGWTLKGVYGSTFDVGGLGAVWIWEFRKFADIDVARNQKDPVIDKLSIEENDFYVAGTGNAVILREVSDWLVLPPKKAKKGK